MFKGMEYVYEVYKENSFSKAARNLYISQPSLSAMIKKIESQVGFDIFDRSTSPIRLTEYGREYIKAVERIMEVESGFENYRNDLKDLKTGDISLGGTNFFTSFILPPIITEFAKQFPDISINLVETNTSLLEKQLYEGSIDLVIDNYCFNAELYSRQFFAREQLILAVPKKFLSNEAVRPFQLTTDDICKGAHLEEAFPLVPLDNFKEDLFLFLKEGNDTRLRADKICHHNHFSPNIALMLDQQITAYNLTCYGMGISFISDTLIKNVKPDDHVLYYKLDNRDSTRDICFYYKHSRYMKKSTKEFLKMVSVKRKEASEKGADREA